MRYLLNDNAELSQKARDIIDSNTNLFVCDGVCAEIVYVLSKVYGVEREIISLKVVEFLNKENIHVSNKEIATKSLELFANQNIDYIDCLLCAYNHVENFKVETFDNKLQKLLKKIHN